MTARIEHKKPYVGFARRILVEDPILSDELPAPYDILDDEGQAYILTTMNGEVKMAPFEGKQVFPTFFRLIANPVEATELKSNVNLIDYGLIESVMVPQGSVFITPEKHFLGVMPILYDLKEEETKPSEFEVGWVMDELIGLMILNPPRTCCYQEGRSAKSC